SYEYASVISDALRKKLISLMDLHPDGIRCSELAQLYKEMYKVQLNYKEVGFVSIFQMVTNIPDVFYCVRESSEDWTLYDARKPPPEKPVANNISTSRGYNYKSSEPHVPGKIKSNIERLLKVYSSGVWSHDFLNKYQEMFGQTINLKILNFDSLESLLLLLNGELVHMRYAAGKIMVYPCTPQLSSDSSDGPLPHITEDHILELFLPEVIGPKDTIPQQKLPPDIGPDSYLEVLVAEVYTPQRFWIQLRGEHTHRALDKLMNEMQPFYEDLSDYEMPEATIRVDQFCVAPYNEEYHRARIIAVPNLVEVLVSFIDYGTESKVKKSQLRFMHQDFTKLPAQAIKASLANLKPANGATRWPRAAGHRFLELVTDKNLISIVWSADHEKRELEVALVDTTGEEDIHINDTLKREGYAEYKTSGSVRTQPQQR
ncbi:hypothetical protein L9F63_004118, partial [Diploptera punctata]